MLTPAFELTQNEEFLFVSIQVPYAKISEVDVDIDEDIFMFYCKPYYLRLNLPGKVCQKEPSVKYDVDKKIFTIKARKAIKGEKFEGLDLLTLLLAPKKEGSNDDQECDEFDWSIELKPSEDKFGDITVLGQHCGFNNSYSFAAFNLKEEADELFEITEPQNKTRQSRREERIERESNLFNEDHYIADLYQDEDIKPLISLPSHWDGIYEKAQNNSSDLSEEKFSFTRKESDRLRNFPNKEYLLDQDQHKSALLGLVDILFAYAYNKRTTEGENTVESAWTINRISATLSWLEVFISIQDVVITCLRRSLIYPLYRHFELSLTVLEDVIKLLKSGRKHVMRCLLEIFELFANSEPRYILNDLYIMDYNIWIQNKSCSSKTLRLLAEALEKVLLTKGDIGLSLVNIESFAAVAWLNQENGNEIISSQVGSVSVARTSVSNDEHRDASTDNSSDSESSSDSDSSDSDSSTSESDSNQSSDNYETSSSKANSDAYTSDSESDSDTSSDSDNDNASSYLLKAAASGERKL